MVVKKINYRNNFDDGFLYYIYIFFYLPYLIVTREYARPQTELLGFLREIFETMSTIRNTVQGHKVSQTFYLKYVRIL